MAALHLRGCPKNCVCQLTGIHFWVTELLSKSSCSQTCVCPPPPSFECLSFTALSDFCAVWHQKAVFTMIAKSVNHPGKWQAGGSGRERQRHHSAYYTVPSTWIEAVISKLKKKKKKLCDLALRMRACKRDLWHHKKFRAGPGPIFSEHKSDLETWSLQFFLPWECTLK